MAVLSAGISPGIALSDTTKLSRAGMPALNHFRIGEGVDISDNRYHDQIDNNPYQQV